VIDHTYIYIVKHARRYGRVKVQRKELLASTSSLVMVAIARIHYSVIVLHGSHTNGKEEKREREKPTSHVVMFR
jgi:hypothetical protein